MRRTSILSVMVFTLALGALLPVAAQDATPPAGSADSASPAIGVPLTFVDAEGVERASITVEEVQDPFVDFAEGYEPEAGSKYVLLTMVYENIGQGPFETQPSDITLQDTDGYLWAPASVNRGDNVVVPDLQGNSMAPGNRVSGVVGFQIPDTAELARVFYQPESGRLIPLADLRSQVPAGPSIGDELTYEDPESGGQALISVTEVQDPFEDVPEGNEPEEGSRYVLVTVTFENTGAVPFEVSPSTLLLHDSDGYLWGNTSITRGEDAVIPDLQSQDMAPGNRISGVVGFQIPDTSVPVEVLYQPVSGRLIQLAVLQQSGGSAAGRGQGTDETSAAAGDECAGEAAWFSESSDRIELATGMSLQAAELESPETLEALATGYTELAGAQSAMTDIPAAATTVNQSLIDTYTAFSDALTTLVTAGDDGSDPEFAIVEGMNAFNDTSQAFSMLIIDVIQVAAGCGIEA